LKNPFWADIKIGIYFIPLFIFVIISASNSVNITDWLDWLAGWLLLFWYSVYTYITFDQWLFLLSTLCMSIVWTLVAFLWFNVKPAKLYMWDVWSLALWANLWILAMLTNTIFVVMIIWSIFILETLSVIIQLTSKKLRNWKKIFRIAPFHHHLEAIWRSEENVVFRIWLIWLLTSVIWIIFYILQK
jgi:phospho-N-acetylmuramoyl-pentapeptide-transferase